MPKETVINLDPIDRKRKKGFIGRLLITRFFDSASRASISASVKDLYTWSIKFVFKYFSSGRNPRQKKSHRLKQSLHQRPMAMADHGNHEAVRQRKEEFIKGVIVPVPAFSAVTNSPAPAVIIPG